MRGFHFLFMEMEGESMGGEGKDNYLIVSYQYMTTKIMTCYHKEEREKKKKMANLHQNPRHLFSFVDRFEKRIFSGRHKEEREKERSLPCKKQKKIQLGK